MRCGGEKMSFDPLKERPNLSDTGQLWYPHAKISPKRMVTHGKYKFGYPRGAVVHYTAGAHPGNLDSGFVNGYCYLLIDAFGVVHQAHPLNEWGWHAGKSSYAGLNGGVSDDLVGIEIACAGIVDKVGDKFKAWFHRRPQQYFDANEVRYSDGLDNQKKGYYHKYTLQQENALYDLLVWMKENDPIGCFSFDLVLGHDEVSPGRKVDPGASLSMTMPQFRKKLKDYKSQT